MDSSKPKILGFQKNQITIRTENQTGFMGTKKSKDFIGGTQLELQNQRGGCRLAKSMRADIGKFLCKYLQIGKASDKSKDKE